MPTRLVGAVASWGLVGLFVALDVPVQPTLGLAQEKEAVPGAQVVPRHSTTDIPTLPQAPPSVKPEKTPPEVKPFLVPDRERLRQWKEFLNQNPGALCPAPGFVEDKP